MSFRETTLRCFNTWTGAAPENREKANQFVDSMRSVGNTDIYGSLRATLGAAREPGRPMLAVVVTDGRPTVGVTSASEIIEAFTESNGGGVSVFALSGGKRVNRFLLDFLSYRNRGDSTVVAEQENIPDGMEQVARELSRPVLTDLSYRFTGIDASQVYPRTLTHLYLDRPLVIYGRASGNEKAAFQIIGRSREELRDIVYPLELDKAAAGSDAIRQSWVWHTIYDKIGEYLRSRQEGLLDEVRALAARYRIALPYGIDKGTALP
jgi:Ca-activated chloride channel family protein